jgi:Relaxase/Mobilisation nuclease domain
LAGQYRGPRDGRATARKVKLVHNIVLSMPFPTPSEKVLVAARKFAREKFALQYRYAMVLHTDQPHPHVHMVVKAESENSRRLHIDKEMLRHTGARISHSLCGNKELLQMPRRAS